LSLLLLETASTNQHFTSINQHFSSPWKQLEFFNMTNECGPELI
jgi:hypothetical protein